ncbi:MAG: hypothetical protein ACREUQ_04145 [Burkholderiales bacterium]
MAEEPSVNSAPDPQRGRAAPETDSGAGAARWWQRQPALSVVVALAVGLLALWLVGVLGAPARSSAAAFLYMVTLPIALLLPAGALAGALLAWSAWGASRGLTRTMLAVPAAAAFIINFIAIGFFVRFVAAIFGR